GDAGRASGEVQGVAAEAAVDPTPEGSAVVQGEGVIAGATQRRLDGHEGDQADGAVVRRGQLPAVVRRRGGQVQPVVAGHAADVDPVALGEGKRSLVGPVQVDPDIAGTEGLDADGVVAGGAGDDEVAVDDAGGQDGDGDLLGVAEAGRAAVGHADEERVDAGSDLGEGPVEHAQSVDARPGRGADQGERPGLVQVRV